MKKKKYEKKTYKELVKEDNNIYNKEQYFMLVDEINIDDYYNDLKDNIKIKIII